MSTAPITSDISLAPEVVSQFVEVFGFLKHEREDVRKMAVRGISEQSKDNADIWVFLSSKQHGPTAVDLLLQYLHAGGSKILGDILTILINCSADGSCAEMLVSRKVVRKAMRLLDGVEKSDLPEPFVRSVQEMTLMLLNNLTATHISAVDDLLQKEDEDMRGFYLGKLQVYYGRWGPTEEEDDGDADQAKDTTTLGANAEDKDKDAPSSSSPSPQPQRDLRRWVLHVLLNLTRSTDGQEQLLEDDDWRVTLARCLSSASPVHRLLAAQCYRNCATAQQPFYALILRGDAVVTAVGRLDGREYIAEIQQCLADLLAGMLESEEGMARLESINAKRVLTGALTYSVAAHSSKVEVVEENGLPVKSQAVLSLEVCEFVSRHIIPYLDDIIDAYIAPGSDQLD